MFLTSSVKIEKHFNWFKIETIYDFAIWYGFSCFCSESETIEMDLRQLPIWNHQQLWSELQIMVTKNLLTTSRFWNHAFDNLTILETIEMDLRQLPIWNHHQLWSELQNIVTKKLLSTSRFWNHAFDNLTISESETIKMDVRQLPIWNHHQLWSELQIIVTKKLLNTSRFWNHAFDNLTILEAMEKNVTVLSKNWPVCLRS
jgi:hypothetical protein